MKNIYIQFLISVLTLTAISAQTYDPLIQEKVDQLSYDSLLLNLQDFENLGIKNISSEELKETAQWIINKYEYWGYENIEMDTFYLSGQTLYNIVITKTGTLYPDQYVIVDGHYDTYNGPGVNDNGTGTAILLETARIMKDVQTPYSVKFIHFSAEELGLVGSSFYVENTVLPEEMDIRLVFNIDEVGGVAGEINNTITCERDETPPNVNNAASAAFTDTLVNMVELYSSLSTFINYAYGSDYVPFMQNGYIVTGLYEYNESPYPHTINDSLSYVDVDYIFEITKASLAASLYFSNYIDDPGTKIKRNNENTYSFKIYPNPFHQYFEFENPGNETVFINLFDITGKELFNSLVSGHSLLRFEPECEPGMYFFSISSQSGQVLYNGKLVKR